MPCGQFRSALSIAAMQRHPILIVILFALIILSLSLRLTCNPQSLEIMNMITGWLDNSNVYGSDDEEAKQLRYLNVLC